MGVETNGANILNTFNMKEHFDGLFFAKVKEETKLITVELVTSGNYNKIAIGDTIIINYCNAVKTAVVVNKYIIQESPFILLFIESIGFKAFEVYTSKNDTILVSSDIIDDTIGIDAVNHILRRLHKIPHYVFDDVVL